MNKKETGEFFFRYYRKRTASFLANLYKASITGDIEDIHQTRVDVKKILALFRLLEMVSLKFFRSEDHFSQFSKLFTITGRIREIQVNLALLEVYKFENKEINHYIRSLKRGEIRQTRNFMHTVQDFDEKMLEKTEIELKHITEKEGQKKIAETAHQLIRKKAKKIEKYFLTKNSQKNLHKIRQNLKIISAIASLSNTIKDDKKLTQILEQISQAENLIGEWHDRQVLIESLDYFSNHRGRSGKKDIINSFKKEKDLVLSDCKELEKQIIPKTFGLTDLILRRGIPQPKLNRRLSISDR